MGDYKLLIGASEKPTEDSQRADDERIELYNVALDKGEKCNLAEKQSGQGRRAAGAFRAAHRQGGAVRAPAGAQNHAVIQDIPVALPRPRPDGLGVSRQDVVPQLESADGCFPV